MAPRGPRGQPGRAPIGQPGRETKSSTLNSKPIAKAGISKRKGPSRVDTDGDLDMSASVRRSTRNTTAGTSTRGASSGKSVPSKGGARMAQAVQKHLKNGDVDLESRTGEGRKSRPGQNLLYLRVYGLKESKAARNPDGGLSDLLAFLERKASTFTAGRQRRQVKIKKVCELTRDF